MINRVLIVGLGSIGRRHLKIIKGLLPNAEIRVLRHQYSPEPAKIADIFLYSIEEAIDFSPCIAVIANPATFHLKVAQPLAENGVHLLIEKPLSASTDGVPLLIHTCRKQKTILMIGYNMRFMASLQHFKYLLSRDVIGRILSVRCETGQHLPNWRPHMDYRQSVSARRELGGGVLLELSHEIDYLRWLFGEINWVKAILCKQSHLEIDVEDTAHLVLGFSPTHYASGLIGTLNIDFVRHDPTRQCTVIGENGSLRWNALTGSIEYYQKDCKEWQEIFKLRPQYDDSYRAELKHFIACVEGQKEPLIKGEDGMKVLQIVDAARQASETGVRVRLPEV